MISLCWLLCQCWGAAVEPNGPTSPMVPVLRYEFSAKDDIDLDGDPDDWVRRKGTGFPRYVGIGIDTTVGHSDRASLRIKANGGAAALYSPPMRVDGLHTYYLEAWVKADGLKNDAALISVSFLNHRSERIERRLSVPVLDTRGEWKQVRVGPMTPDPNVWFVVLGCHLAPDAGDVRDIKASVWFDDLLLGKMPRLDLDRSFTTHFLSAASPLRLTSRVSGLDSHHSYTLEYLLRDAVGAVLAQSTHELEADPEMTDEAAVPPSAPRVVEWNLDQQVSGFYQVEAILRRDDRVVAHQQTTVAVVQLVATGRTSGEFGWSLTNELPEAQRAELPMVAVQAGINWVKYPLWQVARIDAPQEAGQVATMFDRLAAIGVRSVGVLSEPPVVIRSKFARNWQGVSEVFTLPSDFWRSSLEPVIARFSSNVHDWQLGADTDTSFRGLTTLPATVSSVRQEIQRISMIARVGIPWHSNEPIPSGTPVAFVAMPNTVYDTATTASGNKSPVRRKGTWETIRLSELPGDDVTTRAAALARALIAAKVRQAPAIFATDIFHPKSGLLESNGAPAELFLAWRTATLAMQNAEYIGAFVLPKGTTNAVFVRDGKAIVAVWNDTEVSESLYFGDQPFVLDLWGRQIALPTDAKTGEQTVDIGPLPVFICGGLESVARWRISAQYETGRMKSEYGDHQDAIVGSNTFPQGVSGSVSLVLPHEWESDSREWPLNLASGEAYRLPFYIKLPSNARLGDQMTFLDFNLVSDRPRRFRVYLPYQVGTGDIKVDVVERVLPDGSLEVEQIVTNLTSPAETLDFRCTLYVPGERRQRLTITKLGQGEDHKFYRLSKADRLRGESLTLRLEQLGGRRIINYQWKVNAVATELKPAQDKPPAAALRSR